MMTVRFPNGQAITYNDAGFLANAGLHTFDLYTSENGKWLARINTNGGAVIEVVKPCRIENPAVNLTLVAAFDMVLKACEQRDGFHIGELMDIKRELRNLNGRSWSWK